MAERVVEAAAVHTGRCRALVGVHESVSETEFESKESEEAPVQQAQAHSCR